MRRETLEAVGRWLRTWDRRKPVEITFHGGEPLLPGVRFYRQALPLLRSGGAVRFAVQSNLWFLTDELCDLFARYQVSLGTSLDGPEEINDAQRGAGYFRRTMEGIRRARAHGLTVGCICTFTPQSAVRADEVFDFFLREGLGFSIHAAVPPLSQPETGWTLPPEAFGALLLHLLKRYLDHLDRLRIHTLDAMVRSVSAREGGICIFTNCLGKYLAVDPQGWIYPCQRLAGMPAFRLGNVHDCPAPEALLQSPLGRMWREREERVAETCGGCPHWEICRGGCPYDALAANGGRWESTLRDPYCAAYRLFFDAVSEQALDEIFSEQNLQAVVEDGTGRHGLFRRGKLLSLMRGGPHPREALPQARRVVAAAALGVCETVEEAVERLERAGIVTQRQAARQSVTGLWRQLRRPEFRLVNAYLHVTYACNLTCAHCYAEGSPARRETMPVEQVLRLSEQAAALGFARVVITGGEPLVHPRREALLEGLATLRSLLAPTRLALRTNLAFPLTPELAACIARAFDQVTVSVDGDEATHDARRGAGTYARTVANLRRLREWAPDLSLTLAAVLNAAQVQGREGEALRALKDELGVSVRVRPLLPLGRAALHPASLEAHISPDGENELQQANPRATCGLGMNLYIAPDGSCYPCYALHHERFFLGNALQQGLKDVMGTERFRQLRAATVDSTPHCRGCPWRYLCGGYCRAWRVGEDLHAPPADCAVLRRRAEAQLRAALEALDVAPERFFTALPELAPIRPFNH